MYSHSIRYRQMIHEVPEQPTKLLPEAPVWVMAPAYWPWVLKMTRSGPGEPAEECYKYNCYTSCIRSTR